MKSAQSLSLLEDLEALALPPIQWTSRTEAFAIDQAEPLVALSPAQGLALDPVYARHGLEGAGPGLWVRGSVQTRLERAAGELPFGFTLVVFDAWRSEALQRALYRRMEPAAAQTGIDPRTYVFDLDVTANTVPYPSEDAPHRTGGAVDVGLLGPGGAPLPFGTDFDEMTPSAATAALEPMTQLTLEVKTALFARRLLYWTMIRAGFSNYPEEWWHFDFGNAFWQFFGRHPAGNVYRSIG